MKDQQQYTICYDRTPVSHICLLHVSTRLSHHQREHVKYKVEGTSVLHRTIAEVIGPITEKKWMLINCANVRK
jgi:hypothetical protein